MHDWQHLNGQIEACRLCGRLLEHCQRIGSEKRRAYCDDEYWAGPVPNFGDPAARLLIIGLAPGAHGANRTGRMFTGDRSGEWLFRALHKAGFASQPQAVSRDDGLQLRDCAITAACHCAPPGNRPLADEISACRPWLSQTMDQLPIKVIVALGRIAWQATVSQLRDRAWLLEPRAPKFAHGKRVLLAGNRWFMGSYHPSQQNTFTGRLTRPMFDRIWQDAKRLIV